MAEPFKRDGVWLVPWKNHKGRWKQERTKAKTKAEARRIRNDLERQAERQRLGSMNISSPNNCVRNRFRLQPFVMRSGRIEGGSMRWKSYDTGKGWCS